MVLLNIVTRCYETEAPFYWLAQGLSEQLVQSSCGTAHSSCPHSSTAEPSHSTGACDQSRELLGLGWAAAWDLFLCSSAASPGRFWCCFCWVQQWWQPGSTEVFEIFCHAQAEKRLGYTECEVFQWIYNDIFFVCVCIRMNMMVSFHYNKKLFPK